MGSDKPNYLFEFDQIIRLPGLVVIRLHGHVQAKDKKPAFTRISLEPVGLGRTFGQIMSEPKNPFQQDPSSGFVVRVLASVLRSQGRQHKRGSRVGYCFSRHFSSISPPVSFHGYARQEDLASHSIRARGQLTGRWVELSFSSCVAC